MLRRKEAAPCAKIACVLALDKLTAADCWQGLLDWPEARLAETAYFFGRAAAIRTTLERAGNGELWDRSHALNVLFRPSLSRGAACALGLDAEEAQGDVLLEEAIAKACEYFERPEVLRKLTDLRERALKAYAASCGRCRAIDVARRPRPASLDGMEERAQRGEGGPPDLPAPGPDPSDCLDGRERLAQLEDWIRGLPPDQREVISAWVDRDGRPSRELAPPLNLSDDHFRQLLARARGRLKERLEREWGYSLSQEDRPTRSSK